MLRIPKAKSTEGRITCLLCKLPLGQCKTEGCKAMQPGPGLFHWLVYSENLSHGIKAADIYQAICLWNGATGSQPIIAITRTDFTQPSLMCF